MFNLEKWCIRSRAVREHVMGERMDDSEIWIEGI
jgi:hypothetical protein